jgi:hypothetical protein
VLLVGAFITPYMIKIGWKAADTLDSISKKTTTRNIG